MSTVNLKQHSPLTEQRPPVALPRQDDPPRSRPRTVVQPTRFGFISTFPPTRCGLASFTDSLAVGLATLGAATSHIVRACDETDAISAAKNLPHAVVVGDLIAEQPSNPALINDSLHDCDVVILQHEFGIFGGPDGDEIIPVLESLSKPTIVVFHTVLEWPSEHQKFVIERVTALATAVVVMTAAAEELLLQNYTADPRKVSLIPHGVPLRSEHPSTDVVRPGTILTWGLMGPGKGIEWGIMALALLQETHPGLTYSVIGQTHPKVFEREGNHYREMLARLAEELSVADRVIFDDRYLDLETLGSRIRQSEIVLLPYDARHQVTSGVLVEALGAGKKVISTAFPHARELLSDGAGHVVKHESPVDIANAIAQFTGTPQPLRFLGSVADSREELNSWPQIARLFQALADSHISLAEASEQ